MRLTKAETCHNRRDANAPPQTTSRRKCSWQDVIRRVASPRDIISQSASRATRAATLSPAYRFHASPRPTVPSPPAYPWVAQNLHYCPTMGHRVGGFPAWVDGDRPCALGKLLRTVVGSLFVYAHVFASWQVSRAMLWGDFGRPAIAADTVGLIGGRRRQTPAAGDPVPMGRRCGGKRCCCRSAAGMMGMVTGAAGERPVRFRCKEDRP